MKFGKIKAAATSFLDQNKTNDPATYAAAQQAVGGLLILDGFIGINNPLGGQKRSGIFGTLIGMVLSIIFLFMPTIFGIITGTNHLTASATATIVSISSDQTTGSRGNNAPSCSAVASYTVDGTPYKQQSSFSSSNICELSTGSSIDIMYNPANPSSWGYDLGSLNFVLKIFSFAGGIMLIASIFTFIIRLLSIIFGWKILMSGRALAKTLPQGSNLGAIIEQIKQEFAQHVFGASPAGGLLQELQSVKAFQPSAAQPQPTPQPEPPVQPYQPFPEPPQAEQTPAPSVPPTQAPSSETVNTNESLNP